MGMSLNYNYVSHIKSKLAVADIFTYVADAGFSKKSSNNDVNLRSSLCSRVKTKGMSCSAKLNRFVI